MVLKERKINSNIVNILSIFYVLNTAVFRNTGHIMDYICNTHFYMTGEIIEQLIYRKLEY